MHLARSKRQRRLSLPERRMFSESCEKTVDWNGRLSRQFRRKYMREWKRRWESLSKRDKAFSLIGLAMKAGKCVSGETYDRKRDEIRKSEVCHCRR